MTGRFKTRKGQLIAKDLMPLTPMEEAQKAVLVRVYHATKGNISATSKQVGWSRSKTLYMVKEWGLYDLYPHEPGPVARKE